MIFTGPVNPEFPRLKNFLEKELQEGQILGFDGRTISYEEGTSYRQLAEQKHASVNFFAGSCI